MALSRPVPGPLSPAVGSVGSCDNVASSGGVPVGSQSGVPGEWCLEEINLAAESLQNGGGRHGGS